MKDERGRNLAAKALFVLQPLSFILDLSGHSSVDGFERNRLICERRAFSSKVRFFALRGMGVGTRLAGRWFSCSIFSRSLCSPRALFRCWLRSCRVVTTTPEGRCLRRTALSVVLTCWPPGPLERKVSTWHSRSKSSSVSGRMTMFTARLSGDWDQYYGMDFNREADGRGRERILARKRWSSIRLTNSRASFILSLPDHWPDTLSLILSSRSYCCNLRYKVRRSIPSTAAVLTWCPSQRSNTAKI